MAQLHREGVRTWFDGDITPGAELDPNIRRALKGGDIFVALASPNYLASRYCFETEYGFALRKAARKKLFVVVVLLRQCQWRHTRMARYKLLPWDAKPIDQWARRGDAWENIVEGIRAVVKQFRLTPQAPDAPKKSKAQAPAHASKAKPAGVRPRRVTGGKTAPAATPKPKRETCREADATEQAAGILACTARLPPPQRCTPEDLSCMITNPSCHRSRSRAMPAAVAAMHRPATAIRCAPASIVRSAKGISLPGPPRAGRCSISSSVA